MMKRSAVKIIAAAIVLMASCALAEVQDFGSYTVDVIDGWTAVSQGETVLVINTANDKAGFDAIAKLRGVLKRK